MRSTSTVKTFSPLTVQNGLTYLLTNTTENCKEEYDWLHTLLTWGSGMRMECVLPSLPTLPPITVTRNKKPLESPRIDDSITTARIHGKTSSLIREELVLVEWCDVIVESESVPSSLFPDDAPSDSLNSPSSISADLMGLSVGDVLEFSSSGDGSTLIFLVFLELFFFFFSFASGSLEWKT